MKVFISWSGAQSKEIASVFKEWIPAVIQAVKPYFSSSDIDKGARWASEIASELESSKFGLICLTKENLSAPWLMFEAGALSKSLDEARVCPMLFGITPADLSGPLVQFQAAPFSRDEVFKVIKSINSQLGDSALDSTVLDSVFTKWWPDLETKITKILSKKVSDAEKGSRTDRDILEEVLKITRLLQVEDRSERSSRARSAPIEVIEIVLSDALDLCYQQLPYINDIDYLEKLDKHTSRLIRVLSVQLPIELLRMYTTKSDDLSKVIRDRIKELIDIPF